MKSPFPGMDPYLEGSLWPDLHSSLAQEIRNSLSASLPSRYSIRLEQSVYEDEDGESLGVMFPDVLVHHPEEEPASRGGLQTGVATLTPRVTVPSLVASRVRVPSVRIREGTDRTLITSIEIISPANKRGAGFQQFRRKWREMHAAGVHLVEIDLLRRGQRMFPYEELRDAPYLLTVTRASRGSTDAWPFTLREPIPSFPVPLLEPDPDAAIDLQAIFEHIYQVARYGNDIDYSTAPPPPPLSPEDEAWARDLIAAAAAK